VSDRVPAVAVEDLEVYYHGGPDGAVRGVAFALAPGEGLLLCGGPAAGKTSVLRALAGLVPARGDIRVLGAPPGAVPAALGYGPQGDGFAPHLTLREAVGAVVALRVASRPRAAAREDALERAGLGYVAAYRTHRLDAEGFRRLSLALAIAGDPTVLVLDDPWVLPETLDEIAAARRRGAVVVAASRAPAGLAPALGRRITLVEGRPR
jgi:ABC-type multidrug transport system ATPase subunit